MKWLKYIVARGFIPAGLRSSPKTIQRGVSGKPGCLVLGLLRNPTGINPLATGDSTHHRCCVDSYFAENFNTTLWL
jgi:hypothetical protein